MAETSRHQRDAQGFGMRFLITGSSGQLATEFIRRFRADGTDLVAPPEDELDITNSVAVDRCFEDCRPDVVLNCAAYNNVDGAESDAATATAVNAEAVRCLAAASARSGALLVHYGTDYVFDGTKEELYEEADVPNPVNRYGESKLLGERYLGQTTNDYLLLRLSWVYGPGKQNFMHKLLQWSQNRDVLRVVSDQLSVPTCTTDIVTYTLQALDRGLRGLYHMTNSGYASRYEVARELFRLLGKQKLVLPALSTDFPSPASRPFFSAMSNKKLSQALGSTIPAWEDALRHYVEESLNP